jgi:putative ABC transport system permease protein
VTPPLLPRWLLERVLDSASAEAITGDLEEEFAARARSGGLGRARRWYWRQAIASVVVRRLPARAQSNRQAGAMNASGQRASWLDGLRQDLRFTLRTLSHAPAFTAAAVLTLAIGMGAATAIATAAHRALLQGLPYPHGDRLVVAGHPYDDDDPGAVGNVGYETYLDWRARMRSFDELAIIRGWQPTLTGTDGAERLSGLKVTWNFFRMLGVQPALGRDFTESDDHPDRWRVVLIADGLWRRRFGARPDIADSFVEFNGRRYQVIGVMPASFEPLISERFYTRAEIWAPLGYAVGGDSSCRTCQHLKSIGRLAPGATLDRAAAELAVVQAGLKREHPQDYSDAPPLVHQLDREISGSIRRPLQVLMGAVAFVLLVAAANVAGLILARATDREREIALRAALGASRWRLVRQLLTESLVLAVAAAALGTIFARLALGFLATRAPVTVPRLDQAATDPAIVVVSIVTALLALIGFGLIPAWTTSRSDLQATLREGRQSTARRAIRLREALMAGELAVALVLVAAAGLMYRTVDRLLAVDPGFDPRGVLSVGVSLVGPRWAEDEAVRMFQDELLGRVSRLPGVSHAAMAGQIPLGDNYDRWGFRIEGRTLASSAEAPSVERYSVTPDYFQVMRIPLKRGRLITAADRTGAPLVLLVSETTARTLWPGADPIGSRVRIGGPDGPWRTVVGIVGDVRHYSLSQPPTAQFYMPQAQRTDSFILLVVRSTVEATPLLAGIRREIGALAPEVPLYDVATLDERVSRSVATRRFLLLLLGVFAVATLVMAGVGLYGVVSQAVAGRRREFGIRLALGASRADIYRLVLRRGLQLVAVGALIGLVCAAALGRLLGSQLYETRPSDPATLGVAAALLFVSALAAHVVPLRRATGIEPNLALRSE